MEKIRREKIKEFFKNHSENKFSNYEEKMNSTGMNYKSNILEKEGKITNSNILMNKTSTCFTKTNNKKTYKGQYLNKLKHGKGILYYDDNSIQYEGDFINDIFQGNGKYFYENGEYYIGQFFNGCKHGKGIIYYKDGNIKYDGDFFNDNKQLMENLYMKMEIII